MFDFTYRTKLIIFIGLLLAIVQTVNFLAVSQSTRDNVEENAADDLRVAQLTVERFVRNTAKLDANTSAVSLRDFTVKQYLVNGDPGTKTSVIYNVIERVNADWSVYLTLDLEAEITTYLAPLEDYEVFPFISLIDQAEAAEDGTTYGVGLIDNEAHLMSVVAVDSPRTIGYFVGGFIIDDKFLTDLSNQLPNVRSALIVTENQQVIESQLDPAMVNAIVGSVDSFEDRSSKLEEVEVLGERFIYTLLDLPSAGEDTRRISLLLAYSVDAALERERALFFSLAFLLAGGLVLAVIGAAFFAGELSKPIVALSKIARKVQEGDYRAVKPDDRNDEFGELSQSFSTMISRIQIREAELSYRARHDLATGLLNRAEFLSQMEAKLQSNPSDYYLAVIQVSTIDQVNYVLGAEIAHDVAAMIAGRLKKSQNSALCARLGDNLFAIANFESREDINQINDILRTPIVHEDYEIEVDYRKGISANTPDTEPKVGLQRAWAALYRAMESGPETTEYDAEKDEPNADSLTMMSEMRRGLQEDEFELFVQPKINVRTRKTVEAEGLIRWFHETRGFVPPDAFIPIAEQTGKVRLLTNWVLNRACELVQSWREQGITSRLAINLSVRDLSDDSLPGRLMVLLRRYELDPADFVLEITESALMADPEQALHVLNRLRDMDIELSIDDFGTGYSSLAYLRNLPVNEIKIDRSFVQKIATNQADQKIVKATIDLAHGLGMQVTAEGVEDEKSLEILTALGCDTAQGYHISRPLSPDDFIGFMNKSEYGVVAADGQESVAE